jgi:hypothetical protein
MTRQLLRRAAVTAVPLSDMTVTALLRPMLPGVRFRAQLPRRTGGQRSQVSGISPRTGRLTAGRRPEFVAETYAPRGAPGTAAPRAGDPAPAAQQVSRPQAPARFPGAVVVPDEKTCLTRRWVHADDGTLVMEWATAEGVAVHRGTGGHQAGYAVEVPDHHADALTPAGVGQT